MESSCFLSRLPHCVLPAVGRKLTLFTRGNSLDGEVGTFSVYSQIRSLGSSLIGTGQHLNVSFLLWLSLCMEHVLWKQKYPCNGFLFRNGFFFKGKEKLLEQWTDSGGVPHGLTLEAGKPELRAELEEGGGEKANTKEIQGKSCALYWPNYKDLHYSQSQPANSEISFCKGTKEGEKQREAKIPVNWLFS